MRAAALLAAAALALGYAPAAAAPVVSPDPAQRLADRTAGWLAAELGTRCYPMTVVAREQRELLPGASAQVRFEAPTTVEVDPHFHRAWAAMGRGSRWDPGAAQLLIHELLHQHVAPEMDRYVEEGVVEAVAVDLIPAWSWRFLRTRIPSWWLSPVPMYAEHVRNIRAWSTRYSGSRTYRDRAARLARRALLVADEPTRRAMLEAVR